MEISSQEQWSGLPFPPPGDLPNPGFKPESLTASALAGGFFTTEPSRKPIRLLIWHCVLDPSTDTGTWVLEEGGLGFNPCCAVLVGSGHITTHFGCHRRAAFNLEMIGVLCDHGGIGYTLGVSVSFSRQWVFFFFSNLAQCS